MVNIFDTGDMDFENSVQMERIQNDVMQMRPGFFIGGSTTRAVGEREVEWLSRPSFKWQETLGCMSTAKKS